MSPHGIAGSLAARSDGSGGLEQRAIYLDNNATTRALPEVSEAVAAALEDGFGNPSSAHSVGERARLALAAARASVAELIGAVPELVYFTSGATEANNLVLRSVIRETRDDPVLVTTSIEHASVRECAQALRDSGVNVVQLNPTSEGCIDPDSVCAAIAQRRPALVSIQWVNNETGVIQPIEQIAAICRDFGVPLHTDAAQAVGKLPVNCTELPIDYLTFAPHKFHGPPGVGVLYARQPRTLRPVLYGGEQEGGLRPGTENLPGIVGAGVAARLRHERLVWLAPRLAQMRDEFEALIMDCVPELTIHGRAVRRVCNTSSVRFGTLDGQALMVRLDAVNVQCSQGSACSSAHPEPSHVLRAMGLSEAHAYASLRFSFGEFNTEEDPGEAAARIEEVVDELASLFA